ncbi:MAG: lyase family protein, partial [Gammaproteobacteria bacterium]
MTHEMRRVKDSMGEIQVPVDALYGAQTQRAIDNFNISGLPMPAAFIQALGQIKSACAAVNAELGQLDGGIAAAIQQAADEIAAGGHAEQFPVDVFQTGSGTSTNMNANEVIARLAATRSGLAVHPNDHVNCSQSSNDVIPTALHLSASLQCHSLLLPALQGLESVILRRAEEFSGVVKTGRTHLMDAMPLRLDQELGAWATQVRKGGERIGSALGHLQQLALGGTAVGTGVNAPPEFGSRVAARLAEATGTGFVANT